MFLGKVGIFWLSLHLNFIFIFIVRRVDLPYLWELIRLAFKFATPVTLIDLELGVVTAGFVVAST